MFDQIFEKFNAAEFEKFKKYKLCEVIVFFGHHFNPDFFEFLKLAHQLKQESIEHSLNIRLDKKSKIKFLKKELKEATKLIDKEIIGRELKLIMELTFEEYLIKKEPEIKVFQNYFLPTKKNIELIQEYLMELEQIIPVDHIFREKSKINLSESFVLALDLLDDLLSSNKDTFEPSEKHVEVISTQYMLGMVFIFAYEHFTFVKNKWEEIKDEKALMLINGLNFGEVCAIIENELNVFLKPQKEKYVPILEIDFKKIVDAILFILKNNSLPKITNKIHRTNFTQKEIRNVFYNIHKRILGTHKINDLFIDLIHLLFIQFDNTEKSTTKTKFSR